MAIKAKGKATEAEIQVPQIKTGAIRCYLLGTTPLIYNAMSEKARHELLLPAPPKNRAFKAANLKHNPLEEFRNSMYRHRESDSNAPTRLRFPSGAFRKAIAAAALDLPGVQKAQIGRLVWIEEMDVDIYGIPQVFMSITRSADMNHTPDVRTRAILSRWACSLTVRFVEPLLRGQQIVNLLVAAGTLVGIGDWRQQKGSGNHGMFTLTEPKAPEFAALIKHGGRVAQDAAIASPSAYDDETEKMLTWFHDEVDRRGFLVNAASVPASEKAETTGNGAIQ